MSTLIPPSGLLFLDKPAGMTSRQVDNAVQKIFKTRKVGHLGTLDPFATGLLVVAVNKGTKTLPFLRDEEKTYVATLRLGEKTSTGDLDGERIETMPVPALETKAIEETFASFLGEGEQVPPMTSAIKIDGQTLYKLAHQGKEIARPARKIRIDALELMSFSGAELTFSTTVSKGTYIRVLGEDIAKALGTVGHLVSLRRVRVGALSVEDAIPLEEARSDSLVSPRCALAHYPSFECDESERLAIVQGRPLTLEREEPTLLAARGEEALAILERREDGRYVVRRGLF